MAKSSKSSNISNSVSEETEKENIYSRLRKRVKRQFHDTIPELKSVLSPEACETNSKPLTFWGKKLKDLESQNNISKEKNHRLYDFTGTDDSESSYTAKKKSKQKSKPLQKKKTKHMPENKKRKKPPAAQALKKTDSDEQSQENNLKDEKKEEKLVSRSKEFIFSSGKPLLGITSTPASCKLNVVEASSFMFLSPVTRIENPLLFCVSDKNNENINNFCHKQELKTPKKIKSSQGKNNRVLRSRKIAL